VLLVVCIGMARAQGEGTLADFHHTAWRVGDGAPPDIWALAQGPRGDLWLGTDSGLYRFDGLEFERYVAAAHEALKSVDVTSLKFDAAGNLWIGYHDGGISRLRDGHFTHFDAADGAPAGAVLAIEADSRGSDVWVAARGGLGHFDGQRWQIADEREWGYPARRADWVLRDAKGTLWVTTGEEVFRLDASARRFRRSGDERVGANAILANAPDGRVWISDEGSGTRPLQSTAAPPLLRDRFASRLLFDREGGLWGTDAVRGGIFRVDAGAASASGLQTFASSQGLSADVAVPILQDGEGNVWVGTNLGLDRFRLNNFFPASSAPTTPAATPLLAANEHGAVWMIEGKTLSRIDGTRPVPVLTLPRKAQSAYCDPRGVVWIGDPEGLRRIEHGEITHLPWPHEDWKDAVTAYGSDGDGQLWLSVSDRGMFRYAQGRWTAQRVDPDDAQATASAIATAPDGSMWFGFARDRLAHRSADGVRIYTAADGLHVGRVASLRADADGLLVGGERGYATLREGVFESFTTLPASSAMTQVSGIARARNGDLWLNASRGVIRVARSEGGRSLASAEAPSAAPEYKLYDFSDGLPGVALQGRPVSTLATDSDGRLWVATNRGIAWADPAAMRINRVPPPVSIKAAYSGRPLADLRRVSIPGNAANVRIEYSAVNLSAPERVRFRHRLVGLDDRWVDAGSRREAGYSNLRSGHYRFEVTAANEDNVWSPQAASLDVEVVPGWMETPSFRIGAAIAAAAIVLAAYWIRMRLLAVAFRTRLRERLEERERIARELHDTLLQSIQGLILRFQAIANRIAPSDPNRAGIESALDRADQVMAAGRERVRDLRTSEALPADLADAFFRIAHDLSFDRAVGFGIRLRGTRCELACEAAEEIYGVGREALLNAFRHAEASRIDVILDYGAQAFALEVSDDGKGFVPAAAGDSERTSHFGLQGMRERARRVNGRLDIRSQPGHGSSIRLTVPARSAYASSGARWWKRLRALFDGKST
jgi:signal transduction histidine kinase/ligand-binding sensor domain-containing protein